MKASQPINIFTPWNWRRGYDDRDLEAKYSHWMVKSGEWDLKLYHLIVVGYPICGAAYFGARSNFDPALLPVMLGVIPIQLLLALCAVKRRERYQGLATSSMILTACHHTLSAILFCESLEYDDYVNVQDCIPKVDDVCEAAEKLYNDKLLNHPTVHSFIQDVAVSRLLLVLCACGCIIVMFIMFLRLDFKHCVASVAFWIVTQTVLVLRVYDELAPLTPVLTLCVTCFVAVVPLFVSLHLETLWRRSFLLESNLRRENKRLFDRLRSRLKRSETAQFDKPTKGETQIVQQVLGSAAELVSSEVPFNQLQLQERLGAGGFGEVFKASYGGGVVAVKRMLRSSISRDNLEQLKLEVCMLRTLQHPNIVCFVGVSWDSVANVCIVMEFMQRGTVRDVLHEGRITTWADPKLKFAIAIARGMHHLHSFHPPILHRDLKTENVLVTSYYDVKLSDFGVSRRYNRNVDMTRVGTPSFEAPEIYLGQPYDQSADVFSFAMCLVELHNEDRPYARLLELGRIESMQSILKRVAREGLRPELKEGVPPILHDLITSCWQQDPSIRPSFGVILGQLEMAATQIQGRRTHMRRPHPSDSVKTSHIQASGSHSNPSPSAVAPAAAASPFGFGSRVIPEATLELSGSTSADPSPAAAASAGFTYMGVQERQASTPLRRRSSSAASASASSPPPTSPPRASHAPGVVVVQDSAGPTSPTGSRVPYVDRLSKGEGVRQLEQERQERARARAKGGGGSGNGAHAEQQEVRLREGTVQVQQPSSSDVDEGMRKAEEARRERARARANNTKSRREEKDEDEWDKR